MSRGYRAPGREDRALRTRQRVLTAARELLLDGGYARMSIASLAETAGVSPQTVYNSVGGKAEVVKAVYDVMLAGDDRPVPMSRRVEFRTVTGAPDRDAWARAYARWTRGILERVGPLLGVLLEHGPGGDPVLEELIAAMDRERRRGNRDAVAGLVERGLVPRRGVALSRVLDGVWVLTGPEVYDRLVRRAGWSRAAYQSWLARQLRAAVDVAQ